MAKLNTHVTVHDKNGAPITFGPDVELPDWAARKISNPYVWAGDAPSTSGDVTDAPAHEVSQGVETVPEWAQLLISRLEAAASAAEDGSVPSSDEEDQSLDEATKDEPARAGRGSGLPVWQAYAKSLQVEFPDDATREDIIALVDTHKAAAAK